MQPVGNASTCTCAQRHHAAMAWGGVLGAGGMARPGQAHRSPGTAQAVVDILLDHGALLLWYGVCPLPSWLLAAWPAPHLRRWGRDTHHAAMGETRAVTASDAANKRGSAAVPAGMRCEITAGPAAQLRPAHGEVRRAAWGCGSCTVVGAVHVHLSSSRPYAAQCTQGAYQGRARSHHAEGSAGSRRPAPADAPAKNAWLHGRQQLYSALSRSAPRGESVLPDTHT